MTTKINGRTPEEIKRWLNCEISQYNHSCEEYYTCYACPNFDLQMDDRDDIPEATLAYIQQLESEKWELFDLLSSAWYGKGCYFKQDDGTVYNRMSGEYLSFDQAVDEFASRLTAIEEVE